MFSDFAHSASVGQQITNARILQEATPSGLGGFSARTPSALCSICLISPETRMRELLDLLSPPVATQSDSRTPPEQVSRMQHMRIYGDLIDENQGV